MFAHHVDFEQFKLGAASLALNVGVFTFDSNPKTFSGSALGTRFEAA